MQRHLLILHRNAVKFSGPKLREMERKRVEMCSLVRWVHISACLWEKRTSDSTCKRWKIPSSLLPMKSAKTSLCDMGVHQGPRNGWSAYMRRYHWCGGLSCNFGETYAAIKMKTFPWNWLSISAGQCQASFCRSYNCVASSTFEALLQSACGIAHNLSEHSIVFFIKSSLIHLQFGRKVCWKP